VPQARWRWTLARLNSALSSRAAEGFTTMIGVGSLEATWCSPNAILTRRLKARPTTNCLPGTVRMRTNSTTEEASSESTPKYSNGFKIDGRSASSCISSSPTCRKISTTRSMSSLYEMPIRAIAQEYSLVRFLTLVTSLNGTVCTVPEISRMRIVRIEIASTTPLWSLPTSTMSPTAI